MINMRNSRKPLYYTEYYYKSAEAHIPFLNNGKVAGIKQEIVVKREGSNYLDPIITNFIRVRYPTASLNTQMKVASNICVFHNYCLYQVENSNTEFISLREDGAFGLKIKHGIIFLTEQYNRFKNGEINANRVNEFQDYLLIFFQYLKENHISSESFVIYENDKLVNNPFKSLTENSAPIPKREIRQKAVRDLADEYEKRVSHINLLINLAKVHYQDIAFALCIMFYGGLRIGEVLNLTKYSLKKPEYANNNDFGEEGFVFTIEDNQDLLFPKSKSQRYNQVKKDGKHSQKLELVQNQIISDTYRFHKQHLKSLEKRKKIKNHHALFVSSVRGSSLAVPTARKQFENLMKIYIDFLVDTNDKEALDNLIDVNTGEFDVTPHLCRAVFTNLAIDLGYTKEQVQVRRRDNNEKSQETYWDRRVVKKHREAILTDLQAED